ncbi:MAG: putative hydro-lyase [Clostridiales bacterium]|nr:putative hydro-lyase [Clostridiales bacterium]
MKDYSSMLPEEIWKLIRSGEIDYQTSGMCAGYAQANLVILPKRYADDFKEFARKNPKPCPILEIVEGTPDIHAMGEGASIVTDLPRYYVYRNGVRTEELTDVSSYWKEDSVAFLIGCSFSFEEALMSAGIEVRHIAMGRNVPMYKTNIACEEAGVFRGPMVVSMRPMTPEDAQRAKEITERYPNVHGGPVQIGDPEAIGIRDIDRPDYGESVEIREGEIPVFWACGVTPQAAIENAKLPLVITHAPGHMFITNVKNTELNDYLEARKQNSL